MRFQAGVQIVLIILSVIIVLTIIRPEFSEITFKQNEIAKYDNAVEQASQYNQKLSQLIEKVDNMQRADQVALDRFIPSKIDSVKVARDIENIVDKNDLLLQKVEFTNEGNINVVSQRDQIQLSDGSQLGSDARRELTSQTFKVSAIGTYDNMKRMLQDIERNNYPLQITNFTFTSESDSLLLTYSFELETFALSNN